MFNQYNPYMNYMGMNQPQARESIQYVNGIESAKAYQLAPNQTVLLMDSNESKFYIKSADASGFSNVKAYVFTEYQEQPKQAVDYVSRSEFEQLRTELTNISKQLEKPVKTQNKGLKGVPEE